MNSTDILSYAVPNSGTDPFPVDSGVEVFDFPVSILGWFVTPSSTPDKIRMSFLDLHDGSAVDDPRLLRIAIGSQPVNGVTGNGTRAARLPDNGIRFSSGVFLQSVEIDTDGQFDSITFFYR